MKTRFQLTAAAVLLAAFAGASANETPVTEIVVTAKRAASTFELATPAAPQVTLDELRIEAPAVEIGLASFVLDRG